MIISASRRTDIPAFYTEWFFTRVKEKYVLVRNPMNHHQVSRVSLAPDVVDCIVFWTKNPKPMLGRLQELKDYPYYFQFALNPYGTDIECNIPSKQQEIIDSFKTLSDHIGPERVVWRYSPLLLSGKYAETYHIEYFAKLAHILNGYTKTCMLSFLDMYPKIERAAKQHGFVVPTAEQKKAIAKPFAMAAHENNIQVRHCSATLDLSSFGVLPGKCIDDELVSEITGYKYDIKKDSGQRELCSCMQSIDIGAYNTCIHGCVYCYANKSGALADKSFAAHDAASPLLCSAICPEDTITERSIKSIKRMQQSFL